jgi:hypothetical protein
LIASAARVVDGSSADAATAESSIRRCILFLPNEAKLLFYASTDFVAGWRPG